MLSQLKKQLPSSVLMLLILVVGASYLFSGTMNKYPSYVHAWTQSDRVAIAQNFQENGFDFFHPATYNLLTKDGITQVDFPIHDYLVAAISTVTSTPLISVFHWYTLIYSLVGLFFLFQFFILFTKSPARSVFATSFIFTLPFFVYYQNGFLPSAPSFANFSIGLFFIYKNLIHNKQRDFLIGIFFLTIAALARAPFFIFLFGLLPIQLFFDWKDKKMQPIKYIGLLICIALFIAYYIYNQYLGATYGSMFLSELLYFTSISNFLEVIAGASNRWGDQILSPYHGILILALIIIVIVQWKKTQQYSPQFKWLLAYLLITFIGVFLFFIAFGKQFKDHDYYYIDSFLPLLTLWITLLLSMLKLSQKSYSIVGTICFIFFVYFFGFAKEIQEFRYTPPFDDKVEYAYTVYEKSKTDLINWGVTKQDTLYVMEANSTNIPFTVFRNRGYTSLNSNAKYISNELDSNFNFVVLLDSFLHNSAYRDYPPLIKKLERVNGNGELTLYKKSTRNNPANFFEQLHFEANTTFDSSTDLPKSATEWIPIIETDSVHGKALNIKENNVYALTIRDTIRKKLDNKPLRAILAGDYFQTDSSRMQVVMRVGDYYGVRYTISELQEINQWEKKQFSFYVDPSQFKVGDEWIIFIWNPEKTELIIDNTNLILFQ